MTPEPMALRGRRERRSRQPTQHVDLSHLRGGHHPAPSGEGRGEGDDTQPRRRLAASDLAGRDPRGRPGGFVMGLEELEASNARERAALVESLELELARPIMPYRWAPIPIDGEALIALIDTEGRP